MFELAAALCSALGVWLTAKRIRWCWPVGLVSVMLYCSVFIEARLYSDALLQGVFAILIVYGWVNWSRHLDARQHVTIAPLAASKGSLHLIIGLVAALALGYVMHHHTNADLPWVDATLAALSLVAQWWQAQRHRAAWLLWILVDVAYIFMYLHKTLLITALLYGGFLIIAAYGWRNWHKAFGQQTP